MRRVVTNATTEGIRSLCAQINGNSLVSIPIHLAEKDSHISEGDCGLKHYKEMVDELSLVIRSQTCIDLVLRSVNGQCLQVLRYSSNVNI